MGFEKLMFTALIYTVTHSLRFLSVFLLCQELRTEETCQTCLGFFSLFCSFGDVVVVDLEYLIFHLITLTYLS